MEGSTCVVLVAGCDQDQCGFVGLGWGGGGGGTHVALRRLLILSCATKDPLWNFRGCSFRRQNFQC